MIGTRVGNYEIKEKLGEGGMGTVYMGEHPLIGKRVAVKVLLDELTANETLVTRFFHEAKAANDIRHQNIVDILDFGKIEKPGGGHVVYLVMELLEGQSLSQRLAAQQLTFDEIRHVLEQCCSGLAASHAKGIIHRDLKPDNLFLVQRGSDPNFVKILDFGIAKLTSTASTTSQKTRTGTLIGTPAYMSPEQCAGRSRIDARSDVYALGIVMYEMLTGQVPFKGEGFGDIVVAQLTETAKKPSELRPDVPSELDAIVMRAIAKEVEARFQTMDEFGAALADPQKFAATPAANAELGAAAAAAAATSGVTMPGSATIRPTPTGALTAPMPAPNAAMPVMGTPGAVTARLDGSPSGPVRAASVTDAATVLAVKKKDTTLSGAASESAVRAPTKAPGGGRRAAIFAGASAVVVAAAVLAFVKLGGGGATVTPPEPKPQPPVVTSPTVAAVATPKKIEQVEVDVKSDPAGARVVRADGVVVGTTPVTLKLDKGSAPLEVELTLEGYRSEKRTLPSDLNREIDVNLLKASRHATAKPASATPKPSETTASDAKPREAKPAEKQAARPGETKPADAKPAARSADKPKDENHDRLLIPTF